MLSYLTGLSHAAIVACLIFVLHPAMGQDKNLAPVLPPSLLVIQDDCYIPDGGMESEVIFMNVQDVERIYE